MEAMQEVAGVYQLPETQQRKIGLVPSVGRIKESFNELEKNGFAYANESLSPDTPSSILEYLKLLEQKNEQTRQAITNCIRAAALGEASFASLGADTVHCTSDLLNTNSELVQLSENPQTWGNGGHSGARSPLPFIISPGGRDEDSDSEGQPKRYRNLSQSNPGRTTPKYRLSSSHPGSQSSAPSSLMNFFQPPDSQQLQNSNSNPVPRQHVPRPMKHKTKAAAASTLYTFGGTIRGGVPYLITDSNDFTVDKGEPWELYPPVPVLQDLTNIYRDSFQPHHHFLFMCLETKMKPAQTVTPLGVVAILETPVVQFQSVVPILDQGTVYPALWIDKAGNYPFNIHSKLVGRKDELVKELEKYLNESAARNISFYAISEPSFPNAVLSIEDNHSCEISQFKVAVLYAKNNEQTVQEMFQNEIPEDSKFWPFMDTIAKKIHLSNWTQYRGDFGSDGEDANRETYFTVWRGTQIMFHVAPWLIAEQHRRLIGNDLVVIVFYEPPASELHKPFNPSVMSGLGTVPQVYSVIQPTQDVFRMAFFQKPSIKEFGPPSPSPSYYMTATDAKEYLYTKLHNAMHMIKQCPPMNRLYQVPRAATIADLCARFPKTNKRFVRMTSQDTLTVDLIQGRLTPKDKANQSDAYCKLKLGTQSFKTDICRKTLTPTWNERYVFNLSEVSNTSYLEIKCIDWDQFRAGNSIGSLKWSLSEICHKKDEPAGWHTMTLAPNSAFAGDLQVKFSYSPAKKSSPIHSTNSQ
eukprot:TRINITY_DN6101_c0_g1_i1.p1 TRINITY_DN6101_c0_g1~~TRINITY_DN6101_c0_g1_i1.p1  ORF type:complete len:774 (-),score=143.10 TRINITY_DN6101_c0_g1_i1:86-2335(-)